MRKGSQTRMTTMTRNTMLIGTAPPSLDSMNLPSALANSGVEPGCGRMKSAMPKNTADVAMVATMGCNRPKMTMAPLSAPHSAPSARTIRTPTAGPSTGPRSRPQAAPRLLTTTKEATTLHRMKMAPIDRSMPAVSTTKVCAMASNARSTPLLAAVCTTLPTPCSV